MGVTVEDEAVRARLWAVLLARRPALSDMDWSVRAATYEEDVGADDLSPSGSGEISRRGHDGGAGVSESRGSGEPS
jgi:hypothetical protein